MMDTWTLRVTDIQPAAADTKTIFLERTDGQPFSYRAGQFLTFLLDFHGREVRRSYSLSTTPGVDPVAAITVKRVENGEVSRYLLDHLRVGDALVSLPAAGRFVLEGGAGTSPLVFIAAGSGMVPVFSLIKQVLAEVIGSRILLITQQHDEGSILFRRQLEALERKYGGDRWRWVNLLSVRDGRLGNWRMEELLLETVEGGIEESMFYLCGPPAFMRMAQFTLKWMGAGDESIKKESFTVEYVPPPPLLADPGPKRVKVRFGGRDYEYEVIWPDTILGAALKNQVLLPYSCRGGRCSTCTARLLRGKVRMSINEVLTDRDLEQGMVLTCVGYAEMDVDLEL